MLLLLLIILLQLVFGSQAEEPGYYYLKSGGPSGKCIDVDGVSYENNAGVSIWDCLAVDNEMWKRNTFFSPFMLIAKHSGKCLSVGDPTESGGTFNGQLVVQYDCYGGANQLWTFGPAYQGKQYIVNKKSDKCLTIDHAGVTNGVKVGVWDCVAQPHQLWMLPSP